MSHKKSPSMPADVENPRRRSAADSETSIEPEHYHRFPRRRCPTDLLCVGPHHPELGAAETPSPDASAHQFYHYMPKCFLAVPGGGLGASQSTHSCYGEDAWHEGTTKTTIRAENEVEAHREANNYKFGFRKWKGHVTEKPIEDQSDIIKELHSDLSYACDVVNRPVAKPPKFEVIPEDSENSREKDSAPLLMSSPLPAVLIPVPEIPARKTSRHWFTLPADLLPLVFITLIFGYTDREHNLCTAETKFATAITSIIPLSYYIGMGIASISAQSNFAVGAVVNATFGSISEMTFYITALLHGHHAGTKCYEEIVKAALTGTLLGCILFVPGICMIIGGIKHREQRFNSRSAGVSSALLFISVGGVFAPTIFSKAFGSLVCESCTNIPGNGSAPFVCRDCHYDTVSGSCHVPAFGDDEGSKLRIRTRFYWPNLNSSQSTVPSSRVSVLHRAAYFKRSMSSCVRPRLSSWIVGSEARWGKALRSFSQHSSSRLGPASQILNREPVLLFSWMFTTPPWMYIQPALGQRGGRRERR
ncbi:putative cation exchanger [Liparis tanakae]|uniref:Putative cation exchanger n=1 Tax=Liparis tanakae TaxID=230148 RepID=A0A4Z2HIU5_9TELE|nr:putative cation exchanger [Liparis tanakae]